MRDKKIIKLHDAYNTIVDICQIKHASCHWVDGTGYHYQIHITFDDNTSVKACYDSSTTRDSQYSNLLVELGLEE